MPTARPTASKGAARKATKATKPTTGDASTTAKETVTDNASTTKETTARAAGTAKRTPARKATLVPDQPTVVTAVTAAADERASGRTPGLDLAGIWTRLVDHPGYAPELLALAAVEGIGPRARDWARGLREAYPDADPDGLARLATRRFVRVAGAGGAASALAGLFAPVAELAAVLWSQAALVLHLAAAYGRDPSDAERAVELLVLIQAHPDADSARTALAAARTADEPGDQPWPRPAEAAWRLAAPLAAQAGSWVALRLVSRLLPGAALLAAAAGDAAAARRLAARAVAVYRPARRR
ncbi:hypothetical protein [Micromonospora sp. KC723]|uniref:hypothetical protein n=1 Tax=Micromonospora sp. KC723 TaxID=2530381 RepID=UPI00104799D9|nr:hypothetical protein [Micromonospora sp. KC723]TDB78489.1 hypothetical protein E1165_00350 [Micromonospora sp. KC723]